MRAVLPPPQLLATVTCALLLPFSGSAQEDGEWNSRRVLEMVARGRAERHRTLSDSSLTGYDARARGHVYFLMDRRDTGERTLVKADQLALEVRWRSPDFTRQRIVGRRDEKRLPTKIRYHLDHLTVVTDDFSDRITLGEGQEVRSVSHPLAPGSESVYDFRLADSLTIRFPGGREPVRAYRIEVRPRDLERPGYVGTIFLDHTRAAVVRMNFTFTPSSYVDPYLDHIRISLDNGLWEGRYWLPYRQQVEIRRELPILDLPAGSVIQARWRIGDYVLNPQGPSEIVRGREVVAVPERWARSYPFEEGLYAALDREGLAPPPSLEEIRAEALEMVGHRHLSGLRRLRFHIPSASSVLRYNRAEGTFAGAGLSFRPEARLGLSVAGGWAFGRDEPEATLELTGGEVHPGSGLRLTWNGPVDIGPVSGASGVVNTFSALVLETDYLDPYFTSGVALFHGWSPGSGVDLEIEVWWKEVESGRNVTGDGGGASALRTVRPVDEGGELGGELTATLGSTDRGFGADARLLAGRLEGTEYGSLRGRLTWKRARLSEEVELSASLRGGVVTADAPLQSLFLLGGRATLPGYDYRAYAGDRFWLLSAEGSWGVAAPWIAARVFGSVGSAGLADHVLPPSWPGEPAPPVLASAGVGAGLLWDVVQVDLARGLNGGSWALDLYVSRPFRSFL